MAPVGRLPKKPFSIGEAAGGRTLSCASAGYCSACERGPNPGARARSGLPPLQRCELAERLQLPSQPARRDAAMQKKNNIYYITYQPVSLPVSPSVSGQVEAETGVRQRDTGVRQIEHKLLIINIIIDYVSGQAEAETAETVAHNFATLPLFREGGLLNGLVMRETD